MYFQIYKDILGNEDIKLDWMFKTSLISDVAYVSFQKMKLALRERISFGKKLKKLIIVSF